MHQRGTTRQRAGKTSRSNCGLRHRLYGGQIAVPVKIRAKKRDTGLTPGI